MADRRVKRSPSKKSHSWWWDNHIGRKNSKWLSENLQEMDRTVKEMLILIEEEGDSFAKKAEMYYQKRPELVSHVEDFYRMYRALAERYDQVMGDLRRNIPSKLKPQGSSNGSDVAFESSTLSPLPEHTPESKQHHTDSTSRAAGFDVFLGSGGSSDFSRKGSDQSSSSSESESDTDDSDEKISSDISSTLQQRVLELEDELREVKEKLRMQEEKCFYEHSEHIEAKYHIECNSTISKLEEELSFANKKLSDSEAEIMDLQRKINESSASIEIAFVECDRKRITIAELEERVAVLEGDIQSYKNEIENLKEAAVSATKQFETDLSVCVSQIKDYESELINSKEKFFQEKSTLEAAVELQKSINADSRTKLDELFIEKLLLEGRASELDHAIQALKLSSASASEQLLKEKSALEAKVINLSESNSLLETKIKSLDAHINQIEVEKMEAGNENEKHISTLNQSLDALKVKLDMLTAVRDDFIAKVDCLVNDLKCRDDRIFQMDQHLQQLHLEHVKLISEMEVHKRTSSELKVRVKELEDEVEKQKVIISDDAEGKREAIRQLCFSIEHYRDGYHQLRQLVQGHKRSVMAI